MLMKRLLLSILALGIITTISLEDAFSQAVDQSDIEMADSMRADGSTGCTDCFYCFDDICN